MVCGHGTSSSQQEVSGPFRWRPAVGTQSSLPVGTQTSLSGGICVLCSAVDVSVGGCHVVFFFFLGWGERG